MYEFDIKTLLKTIIASRRMLIINCAVAFVLGVVISISIPKQYSSSCILASESQSENLGGLGSLASMAGIDISNNADAIGPQLYPNVVSSRSFLVNLLYTQVETTDGERMTYLEFLRNKVKYPWWINGINTVKRWFNSDDIVAQKSLRIDPERMTRKEELLIESVKGVVTCNINELDYTIHMTAKAQDPLVAKMLVDAVMSNLQDFIIEYRTSKVRVDVEYYRKIEDETAKKYIDAQKAYAAYCDSHQGVLLQAYQTELEQLENEYQTQLAAYTQVRQQVQMAEAKVQEKTPVFTIVEKSTVPTRHSSPKKMLLTLAMVMVTLFFSLGWIYFKLLFFKKIEER